jgi:hypothetical protein
LQRDAFRDWATGQGGLTEATARSHLGHLTDVERLLGIDLDDDWTATKLTHTASLIDRTGTLNQRTKADYRQSLKTYEDFRALTSA